MAQNSQKPLEVYIFALNPGVEMPEILIMGNDGEQLCKGATFHPMTYLGIKLEMSGYQAKIRPLTDAQHPASIAYRKVLESEPQGINTTDCYEVEFFGRKLSGEDKGYLKDYFNMSEVSQADQEMPLWNAPKV